MSLQALSREQKITLAAALIERKRRRMTGQSGAAATGMTPAVAPAPTNMGVSEPSTGLMQPPAALPINPARGYREPAAVDATGLGVGYDQPTKPIDTRLVPGLTEAVMGPAIPRLPVEGNILEKGQAVLNNAALGLRDAVGMVPQAIEDPIGMIAGIPRFVWESGIKPIAEGVLTPLMRPVGMPQNPEQEQAAKSWMESHPTETAFAVAMLKSGTGLLERGAKVAKPTGESLVESPKLETKVAETGLEPTAETVPSEGIRPITPPPTAQESTALPANAPLTAPETPGAAPETLRNQDVSAPPSGRVNYRLKEQHRTDIETIGAAAKAGGGGVRDVIWKDAVGGSKYTKEVVRNGEFGRAAEGRRTWTTEEFLAGGGFNMPRLATAAEKALKGEPLTPLQRAELNRAYRSLKEAQIRKFKEQPETVGNLNLNEGDQVKIGDDWHKVIKDENGTITLKDGRTFEVDVFDQLPVDRNANYQPIIKRADPAAPVAETAKLQPSVSEPVPSAADMPSAFEKIDLNKVPDDLEIQVKARRAKTGEEVTIKQKARDALTDVDTRLDRYKQLMDCLRS